MSTADCDKPHATSPGQREPRYVVVTPARNEEAHLAATIESMLAQSIVPTAWCIVDDGSTDETQSIAQQASESAPWIQIVTRPNRGFRNAGGGVVEAVADGITALGSIEWDYLVKLDADLRFDNGYFEHCLAAFEDDPTLGIAGGTIYNTVDGHREPEPHPNFHVRGATKIYRRACWEDIGGLEPVPGWDTIDEVSANRLGWSTRTLDVPVDQLRATGNAAGQWANWKKNGRAAYLCGYHPLFLLARATKRAVSHPTTPGAIGLIWGYTASAVRKEPRAVSPEVARYVRNEQLKRLAGRDSIWR